MVTKALNLLSLALVGLPLQAQVRVEVKGESAPIVQALRDAVLASGSFVMDRDTSHVRFWIFVIPGTGVRVGGVEIRAVAVNVQRVGPNYQSSKAIWANAYEVGNEADQAKMLLLQIYRITQEP